MKVSRYILYIYLIFSCACETPLEIETDVPPEFLVLDGRITNDLPPYYIQMQRAVSLVSNNPQPALGAQIKITDELGNEEFFIEEILTGRYRLEGVNVRGRVGGSYKLEIEIGGKRFESIVETMPAPVDLSANFEIDEVQQRIIVNVDQTISTTENRGPYLRYKVENVYQFVEANCSQNPFFLPKSCFIEDELRVNNLQLLDASDIERDRPFERTIAAKPIDFTAEIKQFFNISQYSISADAYRFWGAVKKVFNQSGSIFDAPPESFVGNIYNVDDPDDLILGYFEAAAYNLERVRVLRADVFIPAMYCGRPGQFSFDLPNECCQCLLFENSSTERPPYWD